MSFAHTCLHREYHYPSPRTVCEALVLVRRGLWVGRELSTRPLRGQVTQVRPTIPNVTLNHSKLPQNRQRWKKEYQYATGTAPKTPQRWWRDNPKADDNGEDKHQGSPWRGKASMTTTGRPSTPSGGSCVLSPEDDASTDVNSPCLRLVTPPIMRSDHMKALTAQRWEIARCLECSGPSAVPGVKK